MENETGLGQRKTGLYLPEEQQNDSIKYRIQTQAIQAYYTADKAVTPRHAQQHLQKMMLSTIFVLYRPPVAKQELVQHVIEKITSFFRM